MGLLEKIVWLPLTKIMMKALDMKRIHLFEFEDLGWFPTTIRIYMTRLILLMHKLLGTSPHIGQLFVKLLEKYPDKPIIDLCSGSGGPIKGVVDYLDDKASIDDFKVTLTDLYPDMAAANEYNRQDGRISYRTEPLDVNHNEEIPLGIRSMICSFHHLKPELARAVLSNAQIARQPILIYEMSDNRHPIWLWWISFPINFVMCLFITPWVRPMTWGQLLFTYIIPIIPLCFAWDGAVSNARTYTLSDLDILLADLDEEGYTWEKGIVEGKMPGLYLVGMPG